MIIRIQSKNGTKRVEVTNTDSSESLYQKVSKEFTEYDSLKLYKQRNLNGEIVRSSRRKLKQEGLSHGDMIYLEISNESRPGSSKQTPFGDSSISSSSRPTSATSTKHEMKQPLKEDEIDISLWKEEGRINKGGGSSGGIFKMDNLSIEPWDENYLKEKEIKFMSFHAYMRQQTAGVDKGKYFKLDKFKAASRLDPTSGKRTVYDLPSAVTLNRQKFRHVDNIVFENREIVDRFLNYWRASGHQRMAYLYGRYTKHTDVPLGIKAEVCALYEPPQTSTVNSLQFFEVDPKLDAVEFVAMKLGLVKVGWIVSDLVPADNTGGPVKNFRNADTHFLTAEEVLTAATLQNKYPNPCRLASDGSYGSKFATVVVSGDKDLQISFEGYQVSNQCMSLVADDALLPTIDAPELGYVRESTDQMFVSDVYYKMKDKYGNEVTKMARPLPLEYLLTEVPTAFYTGSNSKYSCSNSVEGFTPCNRDALGEIQNLTAVSKYLGKFSHDDDGMFLQAMCDFHLLVYLATNDTIPMMGEMDLLFDAIRNQDNGLALEWSKGSGNWSTLLEIMKHSSEQQSNNDDLGMSMDAEMREAIERSLQFQ